MLPLSTCYGPISTNSFNIGAESNVGSVCEHFLIGDYKQSHYLSVADPNGLLLNFIFLSVPSVEPGVRSDFSQESVFRLS